MDEHQLAPEPIVTPAPQHAPNNVPENQNVLHTYGNPNPNHDFEVPVPLAHDFGEYDPLFNFRKCLHNPEKPNACCCFDCEQWGVVCKFSRYYSSCRFEDCQFPFNLVCCFHPAFVGVSFGLSSRLCQTFWGVLVLLWLIVLILAFALDIVELALVLALLYAVMFAILPFTPIILITAWALVCLCVIIPSCYKTSRDHFQS